MGEDSEEAKRMFPKFATRGPLSGDRKKLYDRGMTIRQLLSTMVATKYELEVEGSIVKLPLELPQYNVRPDEGTVTAVLNFKSAFQGPPETKETLRIHTLPAGLRRMVASITTTADRMAWDDFRENLAILPQTDEAAKPPQVFISYRHPHGRFAESLAVRLGEERLIPWFDKWEIMAGDSLPGRIEEGLRQSIAFIPILTADYQAGAWATEELQTAIAKRIEADYKIIPVVLERCERPELIRHLRYVDFSSQEPDAFEAKVAEVIDGIYSVTINPFRP
jgi:hypothetical protein